MSTIGSQSRTTYRSRDRENRAAAGLRRASDDRRSHRSMVRHPLCSGFWLQEIPLEPALGFETGLRRCFFATSLSEVERG